MSTAFCQSSDVHLMAKEIHGQYALYINNLNDFLNGLHLKEMNFTARAQRYHKHEKRRPTDSGKPAFVEIFE